MENTNLGGAERFASYVAKLARQKKYNIKLMYVKGTRDDLHKVRLIWGRDIVKSSNISFLSKSGKLGYFYLIFRLLILGKRNYVFSTLITTNLIVNLCNLLNGGSFTFTTRESNSVLQRYDGRKLWLIGKLYKMYGRQRLIQF